MSHFQQSLELQALPSTIYAALTTIAGLRSWWTEETDGNPTVGGTIRFRFGSSHKAMRVECLESDREVHWLCTEAHIDPVERKDEWVGTRIAFHLTPLDGSRTRLDFEHIGLVPAFECYDLCCNGWRHFLGSLQQYVETGRGTPYEQCITAACAK